MKNSFLPAPSRFAKSVAVAVVACSAAVQLAGATGLVVDVGTVSIPGTGQFDLRDNNMIVRTTSYATIEGYVLSGAYSGVNGYFDGPGINSSVAAAEPLGLTAVGYLNNANFGFASFPYDANFNPIAGAHATPLGTEIFVKYTYYGDADLNGVVDVGGDLNQYLSGLAGAGQGWEWGDFDLSGGPTDTGADLNQFLFGLSGQGAPLVSQGIAPAGISQVPEPSSIGLLLVGVVGFLSRRFTKSTAAL